MSRFSSNWNIFNSLKGGTRPPMEGLYVYLLAAFIGYVIADLSIITVRPKMLPNDAPPVKMNRSKGNPFISKMTYEGIIERNIFNSDRKIPPALSSEGKEEINSDGPAILSQLPLQLEGTIVHMDEKKSVASINLKSKNETRVLSLTEEIEGVARITKIERRKVTFKNLSNGRMEYIEIPKDAKISFGVKNNSPINSNSEVEKRGEFDFSVKRDDIKKYTSNLSDVLNQARMVPNILPGSGGRVEGFRFVSINPGSIYEKLGFKPMDVIKFVNGEAVNSPTRAMEFYNSLKSANNIELGVERNGKEETFTYTISE